MPLITLNVTKDSQIEVKVIGKSLTSNAIWDPLCLIIFNRLTSRYLLLYTSPHENTLEVDCVK